MLFRQKSSDLLIQLSFNQCLNKTIYKMRRNIFLTITLVAAILFAAPSYAQKVNKLTKKEKKEGWTLLFNGKDFSGWRQCNGTAMPKNWVVEDNAMKIFTAPDKRPGQGSNGDVVYSTKKFKNFELSVDWKAGKATNSGIFYYVREVPGKPIYYAAPEIQVLDNKDAGDNKLANHLAGSLYDILPCDQSAWYRLWLKFISGEGAPPNRPINNRLLLANREQEQFTRELYSAAGQLSGEAEQILLTPNLNMHMWVPVVPAEWDMFVRQYGGGPCVRKGDLERLARVQDIMFG